MLNCANSPSYREKFSVVMIMPTGADNKIRGRIRFNNVINDIHGREFSSSYHCSALYVLAFVLA